MSIRRRPCIRRRRGRSSRHGCPRPPRPPPVSRRRSLRARPRCARAGGSWCPRRCARCCRASDRRPRAPAARRRGPRQQGRQQIPHPIVPHPADQGDPAGLAQRIDPVEQAEQIAGSRSGPHLIPIGLARPRTNSTWAEPGKKVRWPTHRKWAEPAKKRPRPRIRRAAADQRLLEREQQSLVAGVEGAAVRRRQRLEMAERRRRLGVGAEHALGVGPAPRRLEADLVDDVAAIGGQGEAALHVRSAAERGLANWPASRPSRITGRPDAAPSLCAMAAIRPKMRGDVGGREFREALRAIAALEQEGAPRLRLGQRDAQRVDLARPHQRRIGLELARRRGKGAGVGIIGLLPASNARQLSGDQCLISRPARRARARPGAGGPGSRRRSRRRRERSAAPRPRRSGPAAPCASASA